MKNRGRKEVKESVFGEDFDICLDYMDTVKSEAYLVSRGVRPLALVGTVDADPLLMLKAFNRVSYATLGMSELRGTSVIPLVVDSGDYADVGFAARSWVAETFKWMVENVPQPHLDRLKGLLLGYSVDAIADNDEWMSGRLFNDPLSTGDRRLLQKSTEQNDFPSCTEETSHREKEG